MAVTRVHVAVGVVTDSAGRVLIARRPNNVHQGGLWEFPGGKVEQGESVQDALSRELNEELGIRVLTVTPLIQIEHDYGDKVVLLDVHRVQTFTGEPHGKEGQPVRWILPDALSGYDFPAANKPIIRALLLPESMLITGEFADIDEFSARLHRALARGIRLVQLRAPEVDASTYVRLFMLAQSVCKEAGAILIANRSDMEDAAPAIHWSAERMLKASVKPAAANLVGASCHNPEEIRQANRLELDYICLSPVRPTLSHPGQSALGWETFAEWVRVARMPVYALGGLDDTHHNTAIEMGAQGIAAIRAWW